MTEEPIAGIGLVEFLSDLRMELARAQEQGMSDEGGLRLGVEELTVTLEVVHERTLSADVAGKVSGRFWVFGSAEASGSAGRQATQSGTQTLTLTLRPRIESTVTDAQGETTTTILGLDVEGTVGSGEQAPPARTESEAE